MVQAPSKRLLTEVTGHKVGRGTVRVYDDFTASADGAISGRTPAAGSAWQTTGANPPAVASGAATSTGTGYMFQTLADKARLIMSDMAFTAGGGVMTMACCVAGDGTMLNNMVHFNFGPIGFSVTVRRDAGTFDAIPGLSGSWARPLATDGSETGVFLAILRRDTITVIGPDGIPRTSKPDTRIGALSGNTVFWEPNAGAQMKSCMAVAKGATGQASFIDFMLDMASHPITDGSAVAVVAQSMARPASASMACPTCRRSRSARP
jgi:hypothetical protein